MRTELLIAVPVILIVGLIIGVWGIHNAAPGASACTLGNCPLQIGASNSGGTFHYGVGTRFSMYLNETENPTADFSVTCTPDTAVNAIANIIPTQPPYYSLSFQGEAPGTCTFKNDRFRATVIIEDQPAS